MGRPYTLSDPQYSPYRGDTWRPSMHRTDAHRRALHGHIEPLRYDYGRAWWQFWKGTDHA